MSVFTSLHEEEIQAFLGQYDIGDLISFQGIRDGITNSNFYLSTTTGNFILTLYEQLSHADLSEIQHLQLYACEHGFPGAEIICGQSGEFHLSLASKPAAILQKIPGSTNYPITSSLCKKIGVTLAQFHLDCMDLDFNRVNPRGMPWMFSTAQSLLKFLSAKDSKLLSEELDYLSRFSKLSLPSGPIHGDLFPDNVLVEHNKICGIIDFDYACHEVWLFDLCIAVNAWCSDKNGQLNRIRMRDMIAAYNSIRPLTEDENLSIPMMLRAAALRFWLSRLYDRQHVVCDDQSFHKDPQEFRNMLIARRQRLSGMQR